MSSVDVVTGFVSAVVYSVDVVTGFVSAVVSLVSVTASVVKVSSGGQHTDDFPHFNKIFFIIPLCRSLQSLLVKQSKGALQENLAEEPQKTEKSQVISM